MTSELVPRPEVAFYYPGHLWHSPDWIKTLLLFFDGVGLLVPEYKLSEPEAADPVLAGPLHEQGLLHYLVADQVVDAKATAQLATVMTDVITSGALDQLARGSGAFHAISKSRMGFYGDHGLAEMVFDELHRRGLARESEDGVSVPVHPVVRSLMLVLLAQILRPQGRARGLELSPTTDQQQVVDALAALLDAPAAPSHGNVVAFDLREVTVDLSAIPLDEVLDFRAQHLGAHRRYMKEVRVFAHYLSSLPSAERDREMVDRKAELSELARELRERSTAAWRRPAKFALGLAGATWKLKTGDPIGALFDLGKVLLGSEPPESAEVGAYTYLFAANRQFARRS